MGARDSTLSANSQAPGNLGPVFQPVCRPVYPEQSRSMYNIIVMIMLFVSFVFIYIHDNQLSNQLSVLEYFLP